jgi:hypothetical protein
MCRHSVDAVSYGGFAKLHLLIVASSSHHESANLRLENLVRTISQCHRRQTNLAPRGCAVPGQHPVFILSYRASSHSLLASLLPSPCTVSLCLRSAPALSESGVTAGGGRSVFLGAEERAPGLVDAPKGNRSKPTPLSTNRTKERPPTPSPRRCGQSYRGLVTVPIPSTARCRTI